MRLSFRLLILVLFMHSAMATAGELEMFGGANSTTYDDASDANSWGLSLRAKYNFNKADSGWFGLLNAPGLSLLAGEVGAGYEWKSSGEFYFEGGLGASYSRIWGPKPMVLVGVGFRVSDSLFFDFPVILTSALAWMPFIGYSF